MDERYELRGKEARARLEEIEERLRQSAERIRELQGEAVESAESEPNRALRAAVAAQNAIVNQKQAGWNLVRSLEASAAVHERVAAYLATAGRNDEAERHLRQAAQDRAKAGEVEDGLL